MKKLKGLVIAVDFDFTLCNTKYPKMGQQTKQQKQLMDILIQLRKNGTKLILWTCRQNKNPDNSTTLTDAINWCKQRGLEFDAVNDNLEQRIKQFDNNSRKINADIYIDDKSLSFNSALNKQTITVLKKILQENE